MSLQLADERASDETETLIGPEGLTPEDVDDAWQRLLEETLPPEKQEALMETYLDEPDHRRRYNMLLEFSSYLRQGATAGQADAKAAQRARVRSSALHPALHDDDDDVSLCWEVTRVLLIVAAVVGGVLGFAYWLGKHLKDAGLDADDPVEAIAAMAAALRDEVAEDDERG